MCLSVFAKKQRSKDRDHECLKESSMELDRSEIGPLVDML